MNLLHGDCLERLKELPDCSVDACVTDPPYGLSFMGKAWDYDVPQADVWREVLRVLKPGGHLLAFAGTRTQHRMAVQIEDAGFEIRDLIAWVYGSGFPKSLDVSKAIDKAAGAEREVVGPGRWNHVKGSNDAQSDCLIRPGGKHVETAPATEAAQQWQGWGTALKPALEPITVARKPLLGTVAENVLRHGTGALNVDGCRVGTSKQVPASASSTPNAIYGKELGSLGTGGTGSGFDPNVGRWPANLIHDGSDEVLALFPQTASGGGNRNGVQKGEFLRGVGDTGVPRVYAADTGSAARFFYCAKASKADRGDGNNHPTVKPTELMRYLVRLVTPPGGLVLDPFMGSGSTGKAAILEGVQFIGIEREAEYLEIARGRIQMPAQGSLL